MKLVALIGVALVLTACTSDPPTPKELPPVKHAPAQRVADKDEKAVLSTLATLNPCAFVDTPKGGRKRQRSPHLCLLDTASGESIHLRIQARGTHASRWGLPRKVIAGATVDSIWDLGSGNCELQIPVSFQYAVSIYASYTGADEKPAAGAPCKLAETYAAAVIPRLRTPDKVRHAADRPDLSKNACDVLITAFAGVGRTAKPNGLRSVTSIDDCGVEAGDLDDAVLGLLVEPGPPEGGWGKKWRTIGGKDVYTTEGECRWTWSQGQFAGDDNRLITLSINDCKPSGLPEKLVAAVIAELEKPQAPVSAPDLVYPAGQPTEPNPGACVDYPGDQCEPAVPVAVPDGAGFATEAAVADHHVACAATADAVRGQFPDLRGVVPAEAYAFCSYVGPVRGLQLDVRVQNGDDDQQLSINRVVERRVTVAGHPAVYRDYKKSEGTPAATTLCVDSGYARDGGSKWFWCFTFRPGPGSGAERLVPVVTAFAQHHLR